jgi:muramoyltetrapeptide carboxypeptidase
MAASFKIIKPKRINKNSTIALIAPAGPVTKEQLLKSSQRFEELGFKVVYKQRILDRKGYLAGSDSDRSTEIHDAFANSQVDAIVCIRGGYGSSRIVSKIDFELIKRNPKIFIGYSDITVLLNAIWQKTGLITFHGVVGNSVFTEYTTQGLLKILTCHEPGYEIFTFDETSMSNINPGKASGELVGGNLSLIISLIGTPFEIDFTDKIVFIEDIDEKPYKIDRMLTQLLLAGKLQLAQGIILGNFRGCDIDNLNVTTENSLSLSEVLSDRLSGLNIPVITGFSFGHIHDQAIFPVGIKVEMDTTKPFIKLLENPVA